MIIINGIKTNQYAEPIIKQSINELDKLSFKLPNELIANANNEDAVIYKGHSYTIKEIDNNKIYCVYDVDELLEIYIESKILTALTIKDNMDKLLEGSGWTCEGDNSENRKAFTFNNTNIYDAVMEMAEKYDYEVRFDNVLKKVYFAAELGSDKGAYAAEGLNLSAFNVNRSTYGYATRIEPRGQDGMTIAEVNGGVTYLENKSVTDKTITFYWEDNRYTIKEKLKEAAEKKLKELAEIKTTYEINITDLAALSDKYSILEYGLGDTIRVIGKEVKQRIVNLERHDYDPTKNKCTLASAAVRLSSSTDDIRKEILTNYEITSTNLWLLDDEIKSRVKTEKYEQDQKELGSTLTTMQSDIVQNAEGITSRVSKTEILTDPEIRDALKGEPGEKGDPGNKGDPGKKGDKGEEGKGILSANVTYQNHTNGTTAPTGSWADSPSPVKGTYLWTRTVTQYTEGDPITTYAVAYNALDGQKGETGDKGDEGTGINNTVIRYFQSRSGTNPPSGEGSTTPPAPIQGQYNWTKTVITYTDGTSSTAWSTSYNAKDGDKGDKGDKGATGDRGPIGPTGTSISSVVEWYLATNLSSGVTTDTDGWKTTLQTMTPTEKYLWNYEVINFSDGSSSPTIPVIIGVYGDTGKTGATGRSIIGIIEHYLASSLARGVTRTTSGWKTTMQTTTPTNKYLWNYETITWSSGTTTTYTDPIIIGVHGEQGPRGIQGAEGTDGKDGIDGKDGADGQSVSKVTTQYYLSTSKTSDTGGSWGTTLPAWKKDTYIWTRLKVDYVNPTKTEYTTAVLDTVNNALNEVYDSGVILPSQKPQLLIKLAEIVEEYKALNTEDNKKLDEWSAYQSAYNNLSSTLSVLTNDMSATSELDPANFKTLNETYAIAYNNLSQAIDNKLAQDLDTLKSRVTEAETKITDESILATVRESNEFASGAVTEQVSELAQTVGDFTASLETTQKNITDLSESTETIRNYLSFSTDDGDDGYVELGSSKDALKLRQWRNRISFMNGEIEEAYFSNQAMHVKTIKTGRYELTSPSDTVFEGWYREE